MWYLAWVATVLLGGAVVFDVVDFMPWGFVALLLGAIAVKLTERHVSWK
jgi:hypothetical protein